MMRQSVHFVGVDLINSRYVFAGKQGQELHETLGLTAVGVHENGIEKHVDRSSESNNE